LPAASMWVWYASSMSEKKLSTWRDRSRPQYAPHVLGLNYTREWWAT
jgi:hypothetical protein